MNILVTGGAGFIGSHLCENLLSRGHDLFCIDNFNPFYSPLIKKKNLEKCLSYSEGSPEGTNLKNARFTLIEGDIRDNDILKRIFSENRFDLIVHLAAMAGVRPSILDPHLYYDVNVMGTLNLLEICKEHDIKKFVFASSSSVYGNNKKLPFEESDPVDNPISPYAATKKAGELLCHFFHHLYGISITCLRYFTVYGPRQRPDLAIHKFAHHIITERPIPVFGDLTSKRDYTYIEDIIDGTLKAIDFVMSGDHYEIFNLGESDAIPISDMIKTLEKHLNMTAIIENYPPQEGDVWQTHASIRKSGELLGYKPTTKFDEGIELFVQWLRQEEG